MNAMIHTSVTRIADLNTRSYDVIERPFADWQTGDYVLAQVTHRPKPGITVENSQGRGVEVMEGETIVGALGTRRATLDIVGSWENVQADGVMNVITKGGVLGAVTSISPFSREPIEVEYRGHVALDDRIARMPDFALDAPKRALETPVVLVVGTSMSAGKTMSVRVITRVLAERGYRVAASKLTGAGAYRDILSMNVAGAEMIYDFVDAGLPTTVVPDSVYTSAIRPVLSAMQTADVIVGEVGASPLEPYNGERIISLLDDNVVFDVLCASDPYAVVGIEDSFGRAPDVVAGIATNTQAGIELVEQLTDCSALNLHEERAKDPLGDRLEKAID